MIHAAARPALRVVEVFADVSCPFTHVELRRLVEHREHLGRDDVALRVRSWPLELINGAALTGDFVGEEIESLREAVAPDLFGGFDADRFPVTTMPALALAACAYRGGANLGEGVSLALRTALFEEGRDISDRRVLTAIADSFGLRLPGSADMHAVHDDWREGMNRGVIGSPHFFVDSSAFFCPTLDITRVDGHLRVAFDRDAFQDFVAAVFARPGTTGA